MELELHQLERRYEALRTRSAARERKVLASIADIGQQLPIVVVRDGERFVVVDGYKRLRALDRLGHDTVRAVEWTIDEAEALLLERLLRAADGDSAVEQGWFLRELDRALRPHARRARAPLRPHEELGEPARRAGRRASGVGAEASARRRDRVARGDEVPRAVGARQRRRLRAARATRSRRFGRRVARSARSTRCTSAATSVHASSFSAIPSSRSAPAPRPTKRTSRCPSNSSSRISGSSEQSRDARVAASTAGRRTVRIRSTVTSSGRRAAKHMVRSNASDAAATRRWAMIDQATRAVILRLREEGHGTRTIARVLNLSRGAVKRICNEGSSEVPRLERAEKAEPYRDQILGLYASCKGNLVRVHEELVAAGAGFSYAALTAFCRRHGIGHEPPSSGRAIPLRAGRRRCSTTRLRTKRRSAEGCSACRQRRSSSATRGCSSSRCIRVLRASNASSS